MWMVKRGPSSRTGFIESAIMSVLNKPENLQKGLAFDELRRELATLPETERVGSPNTLSNTLKTLIRKGLIEKDLDTRKYRVPEGMPKVLTDELGRRNLLALITESKEFMVFHDSTYEKGIMHGFVDKYTGGPGSNAITYESHCAFDSILGHLTRGILDLARGRRIFDEAYFERTRDPKDITDDQLDRIWKELNLHHKRMLLTYEVDSEKLLEFLKSTVGKNFLERTFDESSKHLKPFHEVLDGRLYVDRLVGQKRLRVTMPFETRVTESHEVKNLEAGERGKQD